VSDLKNILIITYYWPPASGPGVQRWLKFAKYLPEYGWQPIILTVEGGSYPAMDKGLLKEIPASIKVYRTATWEPFGLYNKLRGQKGNSVEVGGGALADDGSIIKKIGNYVRSNYFIPDARKGWNKRAIPKAKALIKKYDITHVVTTSPPHSSQLIGLTLKKELNIKWLTDFRDPWTSIMYNQYLKRTQSSIAKDQAYEDEVVTTADHVVLTTEVLKKEFNNRNNNISVITNGYDQSDLKKKSPNSAFEKFTIFFMGNFLNQQSIASFWKSIAELDDSDPSFKDTFSLLIIGNLSEQVHRDIDKYNIAHLVKIEAFQPHDVVVRKMKQSHLLYLPMPQTDKVEMVIPGKTFEYLASKLPILSIGTSACDVAHILNNCKRKPIIDYANQQAITDRIKSHWEDWNKTNNQTFHDNDLHQTYERSALTEKMAGILDGM